MCVCGGCSAAMRRYEQGYNFDWDWGGALELCCRTFVQGGAWELGLDC